MDEQLILIVKKSNDTRFAILLEGEIQIESDDCIKIVEYISNEYGYMELGVSKAGQEYNEEWDYATEAESNYIQAQVRLIESEVFNSDDY